MSYYKVSATHLNLRSSAAITPGNIITVLSNGQEVELIDNSNSRWWKIKLTVSHSELTGFVFSQYLEPYTDPKELFAAIAAVNYPGNPSANRNSIAYRHCPLSEPNLPQRDLNASPDQKISAIYNILNFLDVENSKRYQPVPGKSTYCNIYAYDFCYLTNAYLPRVWWTSKALIELEKGNPQTPVYGNNVVELNANSLYGWLNEWGDEFGWRQTFDLTDLQANVNAGKVGIISAQRTDLNRSGHIVCVIPEKNNNAAVRSGNSVIYPLQSQAGVRNKKIFSGDWFIRLAYEFRHVGYWWHE
jgi:hypothetical protein